MSQTDLQTDHAEACRTAEQYLPATDATYVGAEFVVIHGAELRNSMSIGFIDDLNKNKHLENFLGFLNE